MFGNQTCENIFPITQSYHTPNCSVITDESLKSFLVGRWLKKNNIARIPFGFAKTSLLEWVYWISAPTLHLFDEKKQALVRCALAKITEASQGIIQFYETKESRALVSSGIYFYSGNMDDALGLAYRHYDNNGMLSKVNIVIQRTAEWFASDHEFYVILMAIIHETLHALGINHPHEIPAIRSQLANLPDGVFCSTLAYISEITTPTSQCKQYCTPFFPVAPAELDIRMLNLLYVEGFDPGFTSEKLYSYIRNIYYASFLSIVISLPHTTLASFLSSLTRNGRPLINKKWGHLVSDATLFALSIYWKYPVPAISVYAVTATTKYFSHYLSERIPHKIKALLESRYNLFVLPLASAYLLGQNSIPLLLSLLCSSAGTLVGTIAGEYIGYFLAKITNRIAYELNNCCNRPSINNPPVTNQNIPIPPTIEHEPSAVIAPTINQLELAVVENMRAIPELRFEEVMNEISADNEPNNPPVILTSSTHSEVSATSWPGFFSRIKESLFCPSLTKSVSSKENKLKGTENLDRRLTLA
jgi:hypothetical protein